MKTIYYAIQNIIRGKNSTIIKVVSLSLGLFLSIVLFSLVGTELSYDSFYQGYEDIYVVETAWDNGKEKTQSSPYNIYPTGETLMKHFPEQVESSTVIRHQDRFLVFPNHGDSSFGRQCQGFGDDRCALPFRIGSPKSIRK